MPDPIVERERQEYQEIFTGGTITGITTIVTMRIDGEALVIQTQWDIPADEQLDAEQWMAQKRTIGQSLVNRAARDTNLEYKVMNAVQDHINAAAT